MPFQDPKPETRAIVAEYIAKGRDGNWLWVNLCQDVCKSEGLDLGERGKEVGEHAARILRGIYPNRESIWDAAFKNRTPTDLDTELDHVIGICMLEAQFTITKRPVPPKPEPKPKKEPVPGAPEGEGGENGEKKGRKKKEAAPAAGPAPAPPPPPAG